MKTARLKLISVFVPYVAVLIGLYVFKNAWIAIGLYHFGIAVFLVTEDRNKSFKKVYRGWNSIAVAISILMSVMIFPIIFFFWKLMHLENTALSSTLSDFGLYGPSWFFFMLYFSTVQPLLEELYWRGYLTCRREYFSWTDFAFAGYHILVLAWFVKFPWLVIAFIILSVVSSIWRYLTSRLEGLMVPLLSHVAADVSIIVAIYILIQ
jgi:membrane protease YdiL (CAAX protease family)